MKNVIIAEKPSLAMSIVKAIGNCEKHDGFFENDKYIVTFAFGHLFTLYDVDDYKGRGKTAWDLFELPFIPLEFKWKLKDDSGVKKQFKVIESLIKRNDVDTITNAGDFDVEGILLIDEIVQDVFKKNKFSKKYLRIKLPDQTKETLLSSLYNLEDMSVYKNWFEEGKGRLFIDWLYGINLTRYLSLKAHSLFPVGRVLVPIVEYIYDRDMEIKNFVSKNYIVIDTKIEENGKEVKLSFKDFKFEDDSDESEREAKSLVDKLRYEKVVVTSIENKEVVKTRPKLFSLDTLQNYLFKKEKISLANTLKLVQSLYEKGLVTYPRTNTEYMAENEKDKVKAILNSLNDPSLEFFDKKTIFDDSKIESHSALTITTSQSGIDSLSDQEKLVYNTIKNRFYSVFCKDDAVILQNKINFKLGEYNTSLTGNSVKLEGFLKYEPMNETVLPNFNENDEFSPLFELLIKQTQPPKKITEADLNNYLKNPFKKSSEMLGDDEFSNENLLSANDDDLYKDILEGLEIGTVATRSGIVENAIKYEYIVKSKNSLSITDKGCALIENLKKLNINMSKEKTVDVSKKLKEIYKNTYEVEDLLKQIETELVSYINQDITLDTFKVEKEVIGVCPKCGKSVLENDKSFYCEDYKNCNFSVWKKNKFFDSIGLKKFSKSNMKQVLDKGYFQAKDLISKSGKKYNAKLYLKYDDKYSSFEMKFD